MTEHELVIAVSVFGGVIIPVGTASFFVIKSFIAKAKYHVSMEARLDNLDKREVGANDIHDGHDGRLKELEDKVKKLCDNVEDTKGWVRLILEHLKIPYPTKHRNNSN